MALFSKKAREQFKKSLQDSKRLSAGTQLSWQADGENMVYELTDTHLEIGQGQASPMRGWGALGYAFFFFVGLKIIHIGYIFLLQELSEKASAIFQQWIILCLSCRG